MSKGVAMETLILVLLSIAKAETIKCSKMRPLILINI